jgi:hypothetical protein
LKSTKLLYPTTHGLHHSSLPLGVRLRKTSFFDRTVSTNGLPARCEATRSRHAEGCEWPLCFSRRSDGSRDAQGRNSDRGKQSGEISLTPGRGDTIVPAFRSDHQRSAISPCSEERAAIDRRLAEPAVGIAGSRKAGPRSPSIPLTPAPRQIGFDDRTETEHRATILLPNPVAAHDTERGAVDGPTKFFKENMTVQNRPSLAEMAGRSRISSAVLSYTQGSREQFTIEVLKLDPGFPPHVRLRGAATCDTSSFSGYERPTS